MMALKRTSSFVTRLFISLIIFFALIVIILTAYISNKFESILYQQIGRHALIQAKEIARIPTLVKAVEFHDIKTINHLANKVYKESDANFIVIGDNQGNHLFHTANVALYSPMIGGDNDAVLAGESIMSIRQGSLGFSLRGKAPVINDAGKVVGIVSVGYLQDRIHLTLQQQLFPVGITFFILLIVLFIFSWLFTKAIKRQMFGLEPEQIGHLVRQQEAILESIFEGVIAIDTQYKITAINHAARVLLKIKDPSQQMVGHDLTEFVDVPSLLDVDNYATTKDQDEIYIFNGIAVIANCVRIVIDGKLQGWVISFRDKNDINNLSMQLSQVRRFADNLRVLRHEQLNWMAMLAGLLHMKQYDKAIELLESQSSGSQQILDFLSNNFKNHAVYGLLLGKYSRASELGLDLVFDPRCQLSCIPQNLTETALISILGNLLDNAYDAVMRINDSQLISQRKVIEFYLSDEGDELVIEVADQGVGIDVSMREEIFKRGVTSQAKGDHGIGLYLVASYVKQAGGFIEISDNACYGTIFSVFIPKG